MKNGIKLFFAMLAICGNFALTACGRNHKTPTTSTPPIAETTDEKNTIEMPDTVIIPSTSNKTEDQTVNTEDQIDQAEKQKEQLGILESAIENQIKEKLNFKFDDEIVSNVDIKYFDFEQDKQYNTTFSANGTLTFVDDENEYSFRLGMSLEGDDFLNVSPLYYVDIDETKDLAENYSIDNLTAVNSYLENPEITFSKATLNGQNWNLDVLTPAKIETTLEEEYEQNANQFFLNKYNESYVKDIDFKYISVVNDADYGYLLELNGNAINIYTEKQMPFTVSFSISEENYNKLKNEILITSYDQNLDLKDNYTAEQLNKVFEIIQDEETYLRLYVINNGNYAVQSKDVDLQK